MLNATTLGLQLQYIIVPSAVILTAVIFIVALVLYSKRKNRYDDGWSIVAIFSGALSAILIVITVIMAVPFNTKYWALYSVSGTVQNITVAVQSDGDSVTNNYTFGLSGHNDYYVTQNPRIVQYRDKPIEMVCNIEWVPQGADAYNCNIRKAG